MSARLDALALGMFLVASLGSGPAAARGIEEASLVLDARGGLPDRDVEAVLILEDHLLAGTASGVFAYDGLNWRATSITDTVRWLGRNGRSIWAAGPRGAWRLPVAREGTWQFDPVPEAPPGLRTGLSRNGELFLGGETGLFRWADGGFRCVLDSVRVRCLADHPERGLIVGTMGQGLRVLGPRGLVETVLSPAAGVTDTLPGNYVHALEVDAEGTIHLATSWGRYHPRYRGYKHARERGLITERDPHDFRRAAKAQWNETGWKVEYLYQTGFQWSAREKYVERFRLVSIEDIDGDGSDEIVLCVEIDRQLHPAGLLAFDVDSGRQEWFCPLVGRLGFVQAVRSSRGVGFVVLQGARDQGAIEAGITDDRTRLSYVDARGTVLCTKVLSGAQGSQFEQFQLLAPTSTAGTWKSYDGPLLVCRSEGSAEAAGGGAKTWRFDPETLDLNPLPKEGLKGLRVAQFDVVDGRTLLLVNPRVDPWRAEDARARIRIVDAATGEVLAERPATDLCVGGSGTRCPQVLLHLERDPRRGWAVQHLCSLGVVVWSPFGIERAKWNPSLPEAPLVWRQEGGAPALLVRTSHGPGQLWAELWGKTGQRIDAGSGSLQYSFPTADVALRMGGEGVAAGVRTLARIATIPLADGYGTTTRHFAAVRSDLGDAVLFVTLESEHGGVPIRDQDGLRLGTLGLPAGARQARVLDWLAGPGPVIEGQPTRLLVDRTTAPERLYALGLESRQWLREFRIECPYVDLGCEAVTAITALGGGGEVVGTDCDVHQWKRGSLHESPHPIRRIRGMDDVDGVDLVWGDFGIAIQENDGTILADEILDCVRLGDRIVTTTATNSIVHRSDGSSVVLLKLGAVIPSNSCRSGGRRTLVDQWRTHPSESNRWYSNGMQSRGAHMPSLLHEGGMSWVECLVDLEDGRVLVGAEHNLLLTTSTGEALARGFAEATHVRSLLVVEGGCWVGTQTGPWYEFEITADGLNMVASHRERSEDEAILQFVRAEDGTVYARTQNAVERWRQREVVERSTFRVGVNELAPAADGGIWVGTESGLWRWSDHGLLRCDVEDVGTGSVSRIVDLSDETPGSMYGAGSVLLLVDHKLIAVTPPDPRSESRLECRGDQVVAGAWAHRPLRVSGVVARDEDTGQQWWLDGENPAHALVTAALPPLARGRQRLELRVVGELGRVVGEPTVLDRTVRQAHAGALMWSFFAPTLFLGPWVVDRRRTLRFLAVGTGLLVSVLGIQYFLLLFEVPWTGTAAVTAMLLGLGVLARRAPEESIVQPGEALRELELLLRGFRHRGSGLNPVDQALILARNAEVLHEESSEFEGECLEALRAVLDSTEALAIQGPALGARAQIDSAILGRIFGRLTELRELTHTVLESSWSLRVWIEDYDQRQAWVDAGRAFLQASERLSEVLKGHRQVDLESFLEALSERVKKWHRRDVALHLPSKPVGTLPIPERELAEVLENLIGNALKALGDAEGGLRIRVNRESSTLHIRVEDDGPGIPEHLREKIFERGFTTTGSTGFGLSRCRELVEEWGGQLRVCACREGSGGCMEISVEGVIGD